MLLYKLKRYTIWEIKKEIGKLGLKWALSEEAGFTSEKMSNRVIEGMDELFQTWTPRENFTFSDDKNYQKNRSLNHKLIY